MENNKIYKFLIAGFTILFLGGLIGANVCPKTIEVEKIVNQTVEVEKIVNNTVEVPVETIVEVEKVVNNTVEVQVDNGNLSQVLEHIYDNDGKIEYLLDDLDDDELNKIVDRIVFINDIKKLSVDAVEAHLFDELDREVYNISGTQVKFDEDDLERLRINDDDDEIVIDKVDFEDEDAKVCVTGTFEQDDVKYDYEVTVEFKDGEFDELENIKVTLH
jgi:hypothetical protein